MKKNIILILTVFIFSCSNDKGDYRETELQNTEIDLDSSALNKSQPCPYGTHIVFNYDFGTFNFHRPKTDCTTGFFVCIKGGEWTTECVQDTYLRETAENLSQVDTLNTVTTVSGTVDFQNRTVDLYFPIELSNVGGNSLSDFSVFNADDNLIITDDIILKKGDYPSRIEGDEIIVTADIF